MLAKFMQNYKRGKGQGTKLRRYVLVLIRSRYIPYENTVLVRSRYPRKMRRTQRSQLWLAATTVVVLYESTSSNGRSTLGKYVAPMAVNH